MAVEPLSDALARINSQDLQFYVYILRHPDGTPFYVGKGRQDRGRIARHEAEARTAKRSRKVSIIRGIWNAGGAVLYEVVAFFADEMASLSEEMRLIAMIGRRDLGTGPLANMTDGGEGPSGYAHTKAARSKMQIAYTAERRARNSEAMKRQNACPVFLAAREAARIPAVAAEQKKPERRAAQSLRMKAVLAADPALMEARKTQLRAARPSRQRNAEATSAAWADSGHRAMRMASLKAAANRPDLLEKRREQMSARWASPEARARHSEIMKAALRKRSADKTA